MPGQHLADEMQALKSISIEELQEQAEAVDYLTPREFAKLEGCRPQQVYAWIRKGVLEAERCKCGRTVLCVSKSKATLEKKARELGRYVDPADDPQHGVQGQGDDMQQELPSESELQGP